jgi:gliding motility-associated-like protein
MRHFYKFITIIALSLSAKAQVPSATIVSSSTVFCSNRSILFEAKASNTPTIYSWSIVPSRSGSIISQPNDSSVVCTFSLPGNYTLTLNLANATGTNTLVERISVARSAIASFNASLNTIGFPNALALTNYSSNSVKHYWLFSDTPVKDSSNYFVKNYTSSGNYSVNLVALGTKGCNDTLLYAFRISDSSSISLPNVFTPNDDDVNDVFRPVMRGISTLNAWVYNRYGALMVSWDKINGFWDGYTTSGIECRPGEYFVVVEATGFDGKVYKLKSPLTLIK